MTASPSRPAPDELRLLRPGSVRAAVRLFGERTWWTALAGVVALSVAFGLLGNWQYGRHLAKVERRDLVRANYDAAPVPLAAVLPTPQATLPGDAWWRPVTVTGRYEPPQLLVRNRPLQGQYGYEVVIPVRLPDGGRLLVDRGWVPFGNSADAPPPLPDPPPGTVTLVVRLRPGEPPDERTPPPGQLLRIDLGDVAAGLGPNPLLYRAYGVLAQEAPRPAQAPLLLRRPDVGLGPHLAYAWNWWGFAVAAYLLLGYYALREVQLRRLAARGVTAEQLAAARAERSRRRRPRDEDWEDAATGG